MFPSRWERVMYELVTSASNMADISIWMTQQNTRYVASPTRDISPEITSVRLSSAYSSHLTSCSGWVIWPIYCVTSQWCHMTSWRHSIVVSHDVTGPRHLPRNHISPVIKCLLFSFNFLFWVSTLIYISCDVTWCHSSVVSRDVITSQLSGVTSCNVIDPRHLPRNHISPVIKCLLFSFNFLFWVSSD